MSTTSDRVKRVRTVLARSPERPPDEDSYIPQAVAKRLPREQLDRMVADYVAGIGCTTLARRHGLSENGVRRHLMRNGIEMRPIGKLTPDQVTELYRLRSAGWTMQVIGDRYGISRPAVSRWLSKDSDQAAGSSRGS